MIEADFLSANEFRVCAVLHSLNFKKQITISQKNIQGKTRLKKDAVVAALSKLEEEGIITKVYRTTANGRFIDNEYIFACGGWNGWYSKRFGNVQKEKIKGKKVQLVEVKDDTTINVVENRDYYVRIYNDFIYSDKLNSNELRVFLYLKQFSYIEEFPTYKTICSAINISKPTLINVINSLSEKGLVEKIENMLNENREYA